MKILREIAWTLIIVIAAMAFYTAIFFVLGFVMWASYALAIGFGVVIGMAEARISNWVRRT